MGTLDILPQLLVNSFITGSIYALASAGLALTYGLHRVLNFAHGHLMMVGAYIFYWATVEQGFGLLSAALVTIIFSFLVSQVVLLMFVKPFTRYSTLLPFVTTLALATMVESAVSMVFGVNVKSLSTGAIYESMQIGSVYITPIQIVIIISALMMLSIMALLIHGTGLGRKIRALSQDSYAAQSLGINEGKFLRWVFFFATFSAGYAGIMVGYETNLQPTMGSIYTIKAFAAMLLGGLGNIWGAVIGSYMIGIIENLSIGLDLGYYSIPAGYKDAFAFMVILMVLLVKPQGLFVRAPRGT